MNPMAPVIVARIYAAVNLQGVEDQGLLSSAQPKGSGGGEELTRMRKISLTESPMILRYRLGFNFLCLKGNIKN